ncbi:MAG: phosphoenolpyruvate--protein phosphotransferase [Bryobacteraceae bacterium]
MLGIVIVSHSARLAEGVCELAAEVARGNVRLAPAGGTGDPEHPLGTDAFRVLEAIESVYSEDGVLVFADLGSAVLSAETALEMLEERRRARVRLSRSPVVEGAVSAATLAGAGATLEEIERAPEQAVAAGEAVTVKLRNPLGLHARPAAQLVRLARGLPSPVTVENLTTGAGPVSAAAIQGLLLLGARQGHELRLRGQGAARLAAFLQREEPPATLPPAGRAASEGIAAGPLVRFESVPVEVVRRTVEDPEAERGRLASAVQSALRVASGPEAGIFEAQALLLEDLAAEAGQVITAEHVNAEWAWSRVAERSAAGIAALEDPYLRARAADVADAAGRVLRSLAGVRRTAPVFGRPCIVAARDLTPSDVKQFDPARVLGICLEAGSAAAHGMILARAMGIPAVVGLGPALAGIEPGTVIAMDGGAGEVWVPPPPDIEARRAAWLAARAAAQAERLTPARTRTGRRVRVFANIGGVAESAAAVEAGAEGVGVLRTEFLFLNRATPPGEEEQLEAYRAIAAALGGRPLVIRTLDIGGDKDLPYVDAGGLRGIRLTLRRRDLLDTQLRAIVRAAEEYRIEVLFPMISTVAEWREAKAALGGASVKAGAMIEVPSAVAVADSLAREAGFFSIGTNDLAQYAMAADRTNPREAALADALQPAVLRMIRDAVRAARQAGIPATLCGELAADPLATALLLSLGIEEFSVSPPFIAGLKRRIRAAEPSEGLAQAALAADSAEAVRRLLRA